MRHVFLAATKVVDPFLIYLLIDMLAVRDLAQCSGSARDPSTMRDYIDGIWQVVVFPPYLFLLGGVYLTSTALWLWFRSPWALTIWALVAVAPFLPILNPGTWHDRDRKA